MPDEPQEKVAQTPSTATETLPEFSEWQRQRTQPSEAPPAVASDADLSAGSAPDPDPGEVEPSEIPPEAGEEEKPPEPEKPRKANVVEDLKRMRRRAQASEQALAEVQQQLAQLRQQMPPAPTPRLTEGTEAKAGEKIAATEDGLPPRPKRPQIGDYQSVEEWLVDDEAWVDKLDDWKTQRAARERQQAAQAREEQRIQENWTRVTQQATEKYPDFNDAVNRAWYRGEVSPDLAATIVHLSVDDPDGAITVAYSLAHDAQEAKRISALAPHSVRIEVGKLLHRLSLPAVKNGNHHSEAGKPIPAASLPRLF
jgi:hypothetical protein